MAGRTRIPKKAVSPAGSGGGVPGEAIRILGACMHNLKDIDVTIPKLSITAVTGLSGSGKSTLVMDTLYRESRRIYAEMLAFGRRGQIQRIPRVPVRNILRLSPAVAVHQRYDPRSRKVMLLTLTGLENHLRVLMTRYGEARCPKCSRTLRPYSTDRLQAMILEKYPGERITIQASITVPPGKTPRRRLLELRKRGFLKIKAEGKTMYLDQPLNRYSRIPRRFLLDIDNLRVNEKNRSQLLESLILAGQEGRGVIVIRHASGKGVFSMERYCPQCEFSLPPLRPETFDPRYGPARCPVCRGSGVIENRACHRCRETGLNRQSLSIFLRGKNWADLCHTPVIELTGFFTALENHLDDSSDSHTRQYLLPAIVDTLARLTQLHLGYLTLIRPAGSVSAGELQRVRLSAQLGSGRTQHLIILDEPTTGMHPREQRALIEALCDLRQKGNTVVLIEHEPRLLREADYLIGLGPGAGHSGGELLFQGPVSKARKIRDKKLRDTVYPLSLRSRATGGCRPGRGWIRLKDLCLRNIKSVDLALKTGAFNVITGISGSGKSTLVADLLCPRIRDYLKGKYSGKGDEGLDKIDQVRMVARETWNAKRHALVAAFLKLTGPLSDLFVRQEEARILGFERERFNLKHSSGRCPLCKGKGFMEHRLQKIMRFRTRCPECKGQRFNSQTLRVRFKGFTIAGIMNTGFDELGEVFGNYPYLSAVIRTIREIGMGYLKPGQTMDSLSGGEIQRLLLARELIKSRREHCLYIFDEPTRGLHQKDTQRFLALLHRIVDTGHTVIAVEHDFQVILQADHMIDLGPGAGEYGGRIVFEGLPLDSVQCRESVTGRYIREERDGI